MKNLNTFFIKDYQFIFFLFFTQVIFSQCPQGANCYEFDFEMNIAESKTFKSNNNYGLKVNYNGSNWSVQVDVYSKSEYFWNYGFNCNESASDQIYLYGAIVNANTNGQLISNPIGGSGSDIYESYKKGFFCESKREHVSNSINLVRNNANLFYNKAKDLVVNANAGNLKGYSMSNLNPKVTITLTLKGNVSLTDIQQVKVPGVQPFGFAVPSLNVAHACVNSTDNHCQVLRALKKPLKLNNDVFITAHRGLWGNQAESSLGAGKIAYDAGWNIIEMDVNRSKDGQLLLTHDQQLNRTAKKSDGSPLNIKDDPGIPNVPTDIVWVRNMNYNSATSGVLTSGGNRVTIPKIKDLELYNKWGELIKNTSTKVGSDPKWTRVRRLNELFDLMVEENWDVIIALDLKERVKSEYLQTIVDALKLAIDKGVLDHLMLKLGASVGADLPVLTVNEYQNHLSKITYKSQNLWSVFSNKIAIAPIIQPNWFTPISAGGKGFDFLSYVTPWIALPSFAQFDAIYKNDKEDFLFDNSYFENSNANINSKNPLQFLKSIGVRFGINWDDANDGRGSGNGRGSWSSPDDRPTGKPLGDTRGNLEWLIKTDPGMIVTDRPDVVKRYLELFNKNSPLNKKQ